MSASFPLLLEAADPPLPDSGLHVDYQRDVLPLLKQYCGDCHSGEVPDAGIAFEQLDVSVAATVDRNVWKKILGQIESRGMPPPDYDPPADDERQLIIDWIQSEALTVDCDGPRFPGRVTLRRLNREEYNRTVRDLAAIDFRPGDDFPSDDVGYGFDNIGDVLSMPPVLMERYVDAAEEIVKRAIMVPEADFAPIQQFEGQFLAAVGSVDRDVDVPVTADYIFRVQAYGDQAGPEEAKMALFVGEKAIRTVSVHATASQPGTYDVKVRLVHGKRRLSVQFLNDYYQPDHPDPAMRGDRNLNVLAIHLVGPIGALPSQLPESHRRLIPRQPPAKADPKAQLRAVRENLKQFIPRAFRRPTNNEELQRYVEIAKMVLEDQSSFERAMQVAIQAVLVSPHFLFRVERDPVAGGPNQRELSDFELATRLSYFLWSSKPDDALFQVASTRALNNPDELRRQVRRMLKDPRSEALVANFAGQWLQLRKLETVSVDGQRFSEFSSELRKSMQRETELLFESVLTEDRSIFELLTADFTHVNESLAKLYGIADIQGSEFQRVSLVNTPRRGILGHASILTVTSNPTRTSPVKRGKWILDNLLATPPPPPPPNVPELEDSTNEGERPVSLREQLEVHRSKPGCAACHQIMDPLGFGLENFDAIGRWRDQENGIDIDASGEMPNGQSFNGAVELLRILMERDSDFRRCLASKLLTYALGRGLEYFDECTLNDICANTQARGDSIGVMIEEVVLSHPFRWQARTAMPE